MRSNRSTRTARPTAFWGWANILSFIEKAGEAIDQKQAVEMQRKLIENEFTLEDFATSCADSQAGPLGSLLDMMPRWAC